MEGEWTVGRRGRGCHPGCGKGEGDAVGHGRHRAADAAEEWAGMEKDAGAAQPAGQLVARPGGKPHHRPKPAARGTLPPTPAAAAPKAAKPWEPAMKRMFTLPCPDDLDARQGMIFSRHRARKGRPQQES